MNIIVKHPPKKYAWELIVTAYETGYLCPELDKLDRKRSLKTIKSWVRIYISEERDYYALAPRHNYKDQPITITQKEEDFLLYWLLKPQCVKIGSAIRKMKQLAELGRFQSPTNERTLRRWCDKWAATHPAQWTLARDGAKALREKILKTILRDASKMAVGDVWVADGHIVSFNVFSPITGKPKRMMLVLFFDWGSRMPVGYSLAVTENSVHILLAFRAGCIFTGHKPRLVYLDNGPAFKSKFFHEKADKHDLEKELGGIFPRLNVMTTFAEAYNAKAKVIERFFRTMQEGLERYIDGFRGASIADKPAYLMRNEKWAKNQFENNTLTLQAATNIIGYYFNEMYGKTPHSTLNKQKPLEVLRSAPIPATQKINPADLNNMLLSRKVKNLTNNGIIHNKLHYWHEKLIPHMGQPVVIRYEYVNLTYILVFSVRDEFICQATARAHQNPMIKLSKAKLENAVLLAAEQKEIRKLEKDIKKSTSKRLKLLSDGMDEMLLPYKDIELDTVASGLIEAPKKELILEDISEAHISQIAVNSDICPDNEDIESTELAPEKTPEFIAEMKKIGIY